MTRSEPIAIPARYLLFPLLAALIWSVNMIVTKMAAGVISPAVIGFYRWALAGAVLTPFALRGVWTQRRLIWPYLPKFAVLGGLVYSGDIVLSITGDKIDSGKLVTRWTDPSKGLIRHMNSCLVDGARLIVGTPRPAAIGAAAKAEAVVALGQVVRPQAAFIAAAGVVAVAFLFLGSHFRQRDPRSPLLHFLQV